MPLEQILTCTDLYETELSCFSIGYVVFLKDFGPWKQGQFCDNICIDYETFTMREYSNTSSDIVTSCSIGLVACV